jgi:hypothetical protein
LQDENDWIKEEENIKERNKIPGLQMRMFPIDKLRQTEPAISPEMLGDRIAQYKYACLSRERSNCHN